MRASISNSMAMFLLVTASTTTGWSSDSALRKASSWNWPDNAQVLGNLGRFLDSAAPAATPKTATSNGFLRAELESVRGIALLEGIVRAASQHDPSIQTLVAKLEGNVSAEMQP